MSSDFWSRRALRRHLIAGLIVIAPVSATIFVLVWIFQILDGLLGRLLYPALIRWFGWYPPGIGLAALITLLLLVGWAAELAVGSRVVAWWNALLERMPLTRTIYGAANRIVRTVLGETSRPFKQVVLVEYPSPGRWVIGFLAAPAPDMMQAHIVGPAVSVFVPTTPNPTSGFVVIVPTSRIIELPLTVDQAFTYILSAGSVRPDELVAAAQAAPEAEPAATPEPDAPTTPIPS